MRRRGAGLDILAFPEESLTGNEEIVSATLSFERLHRWQSVFPMRDWRLGRQLDATRLVADEFAALADRAR